MDTQIRKSVLLNVGGYSCTVSDGNAGPGYVYADTLSLTDAGNGSRLNFV